MGIPGRSTAEYRDDPDAVSLHTTPDDYNYDDAPEISGLPPSYADSEGASSAAPAPIIRHMPPPPEGFQFKRMHHDNCKMVRGKPKVYETQHVTDRGCDSDPEYLERRVRELAKGPPGPLVYIIGTHKETRMKDNKKQIDEVTDFRIVVNLQQYLWSQEQDSRGVPDSVRVSTVTNGEKTFRGSFLKKRAPGFTQDIEVGSESPDLREWCHRYCASHSKLRVFRVRRKVLGLDEGYLKGRIEGLLRDTEYRGNIQITFPVEDKNIDIYTSNRINEWRLKTWVCWIFYLTFLWIFTWPYLFFATKRYAVVKAEWFFSTVENGTKKYATISEEQWFERWHVGIRRLALDKFQGEAEYTHLQGVMDRASDPSIPGRMPSTGHAGVDNAVGLLQQGFRVASVLTRSRDPMAQLQGGWGYDT